MLQACLISFEFEKCRDRHSASLIIIPHEYYHPTITHRAELLYLLYMQSPSYCFLCLGHAKIRVKFENLKQSNIKHAYIYIQNQICSVWNSFHSPEKQKETVTSTSFHSQGRKRSSEQFNQRADLICVSQYKYHTTNNTAVYFYIIFILSSHNFLCMLHHVHEKRQIK